MVDVTPAEGILPGEDVVVEAYFEGDDGTGIEGAASLIKLVIEKPDGTNEDEVTGDDLTDEGVGIYSYGYRPPVPGTYQVRWRYHGANHRERECQFVVSNPEVNV